jgi:hypothetical protein
VKPGFPWRRGLAAAVLLMLLGLVGWRVARPPVVEPGLLLAGATASPLAVSTSGTSAAPGEVVRPNASPGDVRRLACSTSEHAAGPDAADPIARVAFLAGNADPATVAASLLVGEAEDRPEAEWRLQRERVAQAALHTDDPGLYELALRACQRLRLDLPAQRDACAGLSRGRLLQLAPDNAAPWLREAEEAEHRHDDARLNEALYRASIASRFDTWEAQAVQRLKPAFQDADARLQYGLLKPLADLRHALTVADTQPLLARQCSGAKLLDANRRQVCEGVARVLLERSANPDTLTAGLELADALGWPEAQTAEWRERQTWNERARHALPSPRTVDCETALDAVPLLATLLQSGDRPVTSVLPRSLNGRGEAPARSRRVRVEVVGQGY